MLTSCPLHLAACPPPCCRVQVTSLAAQLAALSESQSSGEGERAALAGQLTGLQVCGLVGQACTPAACWVGD